MLFVSHTIEGRVAHPNTRSNDIAQGQSKLEASRSRMLRWLLAGTCSVFLILLMVALGRNSLSSQVFHDVDLSGSLRYRAMWIYGASHGGNAEIGPQVAAMNAIRARLRVRYPEEVAETDTAWSEYTRALQQTGQVDWNTANTTREAFNTLTKRITQTMAAQNAAVSWLLLAGMAVLIVPVGAILWLLREIETTKKELRSERNFQTALLDSLQEGIVACDAHGNLTLFNRATREFHGLPPEPIPPDRWAEHFDLYDADGIEMLPTHEIPLFRALQGETVHDAELVIAPKNGTPKTLLANGQPIFGEDGEQVGAVVAMHDITLRRRAERELARLAAVVASSDEAILVADLDGIFVNWNRGAERVYGYSAEEMIGRNASILALPGEASPVSGAIVSLLNGEDFASVTTQRRRKDGVMIDLALSFSPLRDPRGTLIGISCLARDITAQRRVEAALVESEERLRRLCDAAFEGIAVSQNGMILDANPAFASMFGYPSASDAVGVSAAELAAPESRDLILRMVHQGDETTYEAVCQRRDGSTFPVEIRGRLAVWNGAPARVTAVRDITARTAMEEALRISETRFRTAVDAMEEGLILQDQTGAIVMCNASAERILGLTADQMNGRTSLDPRWHAIHEDGSDFPGSEHPSMVALRTGCAQKNVVMGVRKPAGELTWICVNAAPLSVPSEEGVGTVVVTFADITERALTEERFRVLFNQSSDAYMMFDEQGIIDCNAATVAMLRCESKTEVLRLHPAALSPEFQPDGRRSDEKCLEMDAIAKREGLHRFEWLHRTADGEVFPVEVTLTAITLHDKPVLLVVWHDLAERKLAEQSIRDLAVALQFQKEELERTNAELEALATTDGLTGLKNHRFFQERLAEAIGGASRYHWPLSVILLDVDKFKPFNDAFGHPAGDDVLRQVARLLQDESRITDVVARYGGEEFVLLLPQTNQAGAAVIAERMRKAIEKAHWPMRAVTASFGVASLSLECASASDLVSCADKALYRSKADGRNRVTCSAQVAVSGMLL